MKELSLSMLSRGYGYVVSSCNHSGENDGRLEVCFTPQDFCIWRSQDSLLRLSNSGRLLGGGEPFPRKTYSTRRGPLILYSQDMATIANTYQPKARKRKRRASQRSRQKEELLHSTQRDLSAAIINHRNQQGNKGLLPGGDINAVVQFGSEIGRRKAVTKDVLSLPTPNEDIPQRVCLLKKATLDSSWTCSQPSHINCYGGHLRGNRRQGRIGVSLPPLSVRPLVNQGPEWRNSVRRGGGLSNEEQSLHLSPVLDINVEDSGALNQTSLNLTRFQTQSYQAAHGFQSQGNPNTIIPDYQTQPLPMKCGQEKLLSLRLVEPESSVVVTCTEEENGEQRHRRDKVRGQGGQNTGKGRGNREGGGRMDNEGRRGTPPLKGIEILYEQEEEASPVGALPCVGRKRGTGGQSSLAFLQHRSHDLQDLLGSINTNRGVIRGALPLAIREFQKGRSLGSIIMGPDGEIIQLSLFDDSAEENQVMTCLDVTQEQGTLIPSLQVLSTEGKEKLPWDILLKPLIPEHTAGAGKVEPSPKPVSGTRKELKNNGRKSARRHHQREIGGKEAAGVGDVEISGLPSNRRLASWLTAQRDNTLHPRKDVMKRTSTDEQKKRKMGAKGNGQEAGSDYQPIKSQKHEATSGQAKSQDAPARPAIKKKSMKFKGERVEEKHTRSATEEEDSAGLGKRTRDKPRRPLPVERVGINEKMQKGDSPLLPPSFEEDQGEADRDTETKTDRQRDTEIDRNRQQHCTSDLLSTAEDKYVSVQSPGSHRSSDTPSSNQRISHRSIASCEGVGSAHSTGPSSTQDHLSSSCSAVMPSKSRRSLAEEAAAAHHNQQREALAQRAEKRRQEVERRRREREEEERRKQEKEEREERMRMELEEERRQRAGALRLKRLAEEEERRRHEEEEMEVVRREQVERDRERRRQEEKRRQLERLWRMREEEEERRAAERERLHQEEERRREEESRRLQEMEESERMGYLRRQQEEEEARRRAEEERRRRGEEAALFAMEESRIQAEQFARQRVLLEQQLAFKRGLLTEAGGLEKTQDVSRPWIYSYFTLLELSRPTQSDPNSQTPNL